MIPKKIREEMLESFKYDCRFYATQIYGYIKPRPNGEFIMTAYAVNVTKYAGIRMTEVARYWSDRDYYQCKNIWKNIWGGTMIEFDERKNRPDAEYGWYNGKWGRPIKWGSRNNWFVKFIRYKNLDALADTKYKYCAYDKYRGVMSLAEYCRLFSKHKEVEIFAKNGLSNYISAKFLGALERNERLRVFFRNHAKELAWSDYTAMNIIRASKNGWTLKEAQERDAARFQYIQAPKGVDRLVLHRYLTANSIDKYDWYHYAEDVAKAKMDILGFGVAFPKDFHKAEKRVRRRIAVAQAKEDAERSGNLKRIAERIDALLKRMRIRLAARVGDFTVVMPTTREQFVEEGKAMSNCIGNYFERCADGETLCFFIRKHGRRIADVEISPSTGKVRQCRERFNAKARDEVEAFAADFGKRIASDLQRCKAA